MQVDTWLLILAGVFILLSTAVLIWIFLFFRRLSKDIGRKNLISILDDILSKEIKNSRSIEKIGKGIEKLVEDGSFHIQRTALVKYNPFEEMGGEHSFSLAILDGKDTGIIITGLHTRDKTRVYVKDVVKGKTSVELSAEEERALKKAIKR